MKLNENVLTMWSTLFGLCGVISKGEKEIKDGLDEPFGIKGIKWVWNGRNVVWINPDKHCHEF